MAWTFISLIDLAQGQRNKAIEALTRALRLSPSHPEILAALLLQFQHPLFQSAIRLRALGRAHGVDTGLALQALELLESLLTPISEEEDLRLRILAAEAAGKPEVRDSSLRELKARKKETEKGST